MYSEERRETQGMTLVKTRVIKNQVVTQVLSNNQGYYAYDVWERWQWIRKPMPRKFTVWSWSLAEDNKKYVLIHYFTAQNATNCFHHFIFKICEKSSFSMHSWTKNPASIQPRICPAAQFFTRFLLTNAVEVSVRVGDTELEFLNILWGIGTM